MRLSAPLGLVLTGLAFASSFGACQPSDAPIDTGGEQPLVLEIGQYDIDELITTSFAPLSDGDDALVEYGGQGSLMCVVGARVKRPIHDKSVFTVEVALRRPSGEPWARPKLKVRPVSAPDGWIYVPGLYLVVANDAFDRSWEGSLATLELTLIDTKSPDVPAQTATMTVRLVAQSGENAPPTLSPDAGSYGDTELGDTGGPLDTTDAEPSATPDAGLFDGWSANPDAPDAPKEWN